MNLNLKMDEAFLSHIHMMTETIQHGSQKVKPCNLEVSNNAIWKSGIQEQYNIEVRNNAIWQSGTMPYGSQEQCNMAVRNNAIWKSGTMQY